MQRRGQNLMCTETEFIWALLLWDLSSMPRTILFLSNQVVLSMEQVMGVRWLVPGGKYWHFTTMALGIHVGWERRIGMFPTYFDTDDLMYCDTYFGDYPHYAPDVPRKSGDFAGWMLLSYRKPVQASSALAEHGPAKLVDENIRPFWVAEKNDDRQWISIDLGKPDTVFAVQINYNDFHSDMYGRIPGLYHRYLISGSKDGEHWEVLADRQNSFRDTPHDYVELTSPTTARYIRFENIHCPTPFLSISGLRIFGKGRGIKPAGVHGFSVDRHEDRRYAAISWDPVPEAQGYNVLWGIAPDKLYHSWLVYDESKLEMRCLNRDQSYYFSIEAFNENGVGERHSIKNVE